MRGVHARSWVDVTLAALKSTAEYAPLKKVLPLLAQLEGDVTAIKARLAGHRDGMREITSFLGAVSRFQDQAPLAQAIKSLRGVSTWPLRLATLV